MIDGGWSHAELNAMDEDEFLYWLEETLEFNRRVAEARTAAAEKDKP